MTGAAKVFLCVAALALVLGVGITVGAGWYRDCLASGKSASYCRGDRWPR